MARNHARRNLRLRGWDYSRSGAYFITIRTHNNADHFGQVTRGEMRRNAVGETVAETWRWLATQYSHVSLDEWVVMPDHLHGILVLATQAPDPETAIASSPASGKPIGRLVGAFKTRSTKEVNRLRNTPGAVLWQRGFWDRVIRDHDELLRIREYIRRNRVAYPAANGPVTVVREQARSRLFANGPANVIP